MHKLTTGWILLGTAVMLCAQVASAQVAAPHLNPLIPEAASPINPAILPWSGPSRVGAALSYKSTEEDTQNGVTQVQSEGKGKYLVQGRYVGETFALSAETLEIEVTVPNDPTSLGTYKAALVQGALLLGDILAVGVGQQNTSVLQEGLVGGLPASSEEEGTLTMVGVTVQVVEGVFLGFATGPETLTQNQKITALATDISEEQDRDVMRVGVGYYMRSDDSGLHIEGYKETKDFADFTTLGNIDEEEATGLTLEVVFSNILLGVSKEGRDFSDLNGLNQEEDHTALSVGWAPAQGLTVTATRFETETTSPTSTKVTNDTANYIAIGWSF